MYSILEEWKDVVGYENYFQVSNTGKIFSKRTNKQLKTFVHINGYIVFASKIGGRKGKAICLKVHVLVARAFIENPENKKTVNHKDGVKTNNHVNNLEWATHSEQMLHAFSTGLKKNKTSVHNSCSSLSKEDVIFIKTHHIPYHEIYSARNLGKRFGVSHKTISRVVYGTRYSDITP